MNEKSIQARLIFIKPFQLAHQSSNTLTSSLRMHRPDLFQTTASSDERKLLMRRISQIRCKRRNSHRSHHTKDIRQLLHCPLIIPERLEQREQWPKCSLSMQLSQCTPGMKRSPDFERVSLSPV